VVYEPNNFNGPVEAPRVKEPQLHIAGDADRQPAALFRLMLSDQKRQLFDNIAAAMRRVPEAIQLRQIGHFAKADPAYGGGMAERVGLTTKPHAAE
jgi:catalase